MSLFQAREWWSAKPDGQEECDKGCLCVANIDNEPNNADKIVTGSFSGYLRIYYPKSSNYKIDDLILEQHLEDPILQIEAGKFINGSNKLALAVLHPRRLVVYSVNAVGGKGGEPSYYDLVRAYEHKLERTAYNLTYGPFGSVYGKDYICVQSMDGELYFLEQDNFAFSRYLNNFLVPGPLCYVAKIDSFVTVTASMEVECYKYQMLGASSSEKKDVFDAHGLVSSKKVQVDWSLNLGEHVVDIFVARYSRSLAASQIDICVVGEKTLFTLKEQGTIRLQKRLDYNPCCAITYNTSEQDVGGSNQNLIIGTHQNSLMIYRDTQLVWAARTLSTPVAVRVAQFGGIKGFIVTLNDTCQVTISYLGTDAPVTGVNAQENKELDYEAMDEEHRKLLKIIRQASTDNMTEPKEKVTLRAQVPSTLSTAVDNDQFPLDDDCVRNDSGGYVAVHIRLYVSYNGRDDLENISIAFHGSEAFRLKEKCILLPNIKGGSATPIVLNIRVRISKTILPHSMKMDVAAAYTTPKGEPRTARCDIHLPLILACRCVAPLKNCQYMFTLDTNRSPPALTEVFGEILEPATASSPEIGRTSANAMTIVYHGGGIDATILVSKKSGRYRVQSGCFEALALISDELVARLTAYYEKSPEGRDQRDGGFAISFKELLPLHDYFVIIDRHFAERLKIQETRNQLERAAHQFRVIQKRLLVRFKDKNPAPLNHLDLLLQETYNSIIDMGQAMETSQATLKTISHQLSCATQLMILLIRFKYDLDGPNVETLVSFLSPLINDSIDLGWEESLDASMTHLLRTNLAKNARDSASVAQPLEPLKDTFKLKRHIQIVCDRLAKGLRMVKKQSTSKTAAVNSSSPMPSTSKSSQPASDAAAAPSPSPASAPSPSNSNLSAPSPSSSSERPSSSRHRDRDERSSSRDRSRSRDPEREHRSRGGGGGGGGDVPSPQASPSAGGDDDGHHRRRHRDENGGHREHRHRSRSRDAHGGHRDKSRDRGESRERRHSHRDRESRHGGGGAAAGTPNTESPANHTENHFDEKQ